MRPNPSMLPSHVTVACLALVIAACSGLAVLASCSTDGTAAIDTNVRPGTPALRTGDEIVVAGRLFHTGTPVVLWTDPGGYDAYRTEYRFEPFDERVYDAERKPLYGPQRYNLRADGLTENQLETVRGGGWPINLLQDQIDQFVLHYDVCGVSQRCFRVLHDVRGLSVHFMLDIDGTIYQTLDVKERAWHAAQANTRSIGIEIASIGAYPPGEPSPLDNWYGKDRAGRTRITLPDWIGDGAVNTPGFVGFPDRPNRIAGEIHGASYEMYDFTPEQYRALAKLTATLCTIFPKIACDYPRSPSGDLLNEALGEEAYESFGGILGHFHLTDGKIDPGPAMQWERLINDARSHMQADGQRTATR